MNRTIMDIFQKSKDLSREARSELILGLIEEMDLENSKEIEQSWIAETEFRHQEIKAGKRKTTTYEELKKKLHWT